VLVAVKALRSASTSRREAGGLDGDSARARLAVVVERRIVQDWRSNGREFRLLGYSLTACSKSVVKIAHD
jgi:hypothetical protein